MEMTGSLAARILMLLMLVCAACVTSASSINAVCAKESITDSIFGVPGPYCFIDSAQSHEFLGVIKGDEVSLQRALYMVHKDGYEYVAVLFYAFWCPFSKKFTPSFSTLSTLYPSIPHFAIEESAIRPSTLSKYGVHGFPTLFLLSSTMRVRYHGSRTLGSLVDFYGDVTGIKTSVLKKASMEVTGFHLNNEKSNNTEQESCPFSWARSPENMLCQETYLALACAFVILRLLYFFPVLLVRFQSAWRRYIQNMRLQGLLDHPLAYLNRAIQLFNSLKEWCKRRNLRDVAVTARLWASKSLARVSFGDGGTHQVHQ